MLKEFDRLTGQRVGSPFDGLMVEFCAPAGRLGCAEGNTRHLRYTNTSVPDGALMNPAPGPEIETMLFLQPAGRFRLSAREC